MERNTFYILSCGFAFSFTLYELLPSVFHRPSSIVYRLSSVICRLSPVLRGVLMTNKALFWSFYANFCAFYVSFCAFYASLRLIRTVFTRLLKKANNHSYSLPLIPGPQSLTHNPLTNMMIQSKTNNHLSLILNHLYGLHNFAFYILIFDFSLQPLPPNVIVYKYLRAEKLLYICRELSTSVESSLQIKLFMQNKANFRKVKLNVNKVLTMGYDRMDTWSIRKTKPIQSQLKPIQSQLKPIKCQNKPNSNPNKPIFKT